MNCDTFMNMREGLRPKVWALNSWLFEHYGTGLEEEQAEVIADGALEDVYDMFQDMVSRMGIPQAFTDNILYWRFPKETLLKFVLSQRPMN